MTFKMRFSAPAAEPPTPWNDLTMSIVDYNGERERARKQPSREELAVQKRETL